jgi:hypothetical protein
MRFSDLKEFQIVANMAGLEMEFLELREAAARWEWLIRHASLGFDGAPSWNAVVRLPVFDSDDQTITAIVDRARKVAGDA